MSAITPSGNVFIASMNMRGKWAVEPSGATKINVTSAQAKLSKNRRDFSPMTEVQGGYKGYWSFENYWQSGKVFEDIPDEKTKKWWKSLTESKRRYPKTKGKKVLYAKFENEVQQMDYITSRKEIYIPEYFNLIKDREMLSNWKKYIDAGNDVVIYDFDGPRGKDRELMCLPVNLELLKEKINDPIFPFGHGYIIAGYLSGILPDEYII